MQMTAKAAILRTGKAAPDDATLTLIAMFDNALPQAYSTIRQLVRRSKHSTFLAHYSDYMELVRGESDPSRASHHEDPPSLSDRTSEPTQRPSPLAYHPSSGGRRALLDPTTPPASPSPPDPSPSRNPGGPLHPPSALALWDPVEPSRRRSDGDPSSPVGWRALRSEGWKWEGSRTDPSRSGRVEGWTGWRGVEGWLSPLALSI